MSHVLTGMVLFVNSLFDVLNNHDIPDLFSVAGILGGIALHGAATVSSGSIEPLASSLVVGTGFSAYGWFAYFRGYWGGADAMILSLLGFGAPTATSFTSPAGIYPVDLLMNFLISALAVSAATGLYYVVSSGKGLEVFLSELSSRKKIIGLELLAVASSTSVMLVLDLKPVVFGSLAAGSVILYEVFRVVEEEFFIRTVKLEEVEEGDVVRSDELDGLVKGIEAEEIQDLDSETVEIMRGVPLAPAFLVGLVLTDVFGLGTGLILMLY